jgi:ATP-binding cassette, subfamily B, bacterial
MQFKNVTFSYPNNDKIILKDINLNLEKGKSYAFIGPTGEGKSTLVMLMAGLIVPNTGTVSYDGKNIQDYSRTELASKIGYILQDPFLYQGTILDNIIYGNNDFKKNRFFDDYSMTVDSLQKPKDDQELEAKLLDILTQKELVHLLDRFPEGLKTKVNNNSENISLGQKQIINFLRVILRAPEFLILDEATANLDTVTEASLQLILDHLPSTTTMVIIAHRLNTVKNVDFKYQVGGGKVELLQNI